MTDRATPPEDGHPRAAEVPPGSSADLVPTGLGFLLGAAHRTRRQAWEAALSDLDLTAPQAAALRTIAARPGMGLRELSRVLVTDVMNARRIAGFLVQVGLCAYQADPRDARRRPLHPTQAGRELAAVVAWRDTVNEEELCRLLGPELHATVVSGLRRLVNHHPAAVAPPAPVDQDEREA